MAVLRSRASHIVCLDEKWRITASLHSWNFPFYLLVPRLEEFQREYGRGSRVADEYTPLIDAGYKWCKERFGGPTAVELGYLPDESMLACAKYHELLSTLRAFEESEKKAMEASMQQAEEL